LRLHHNPGETVENEKNDIHITINSNYKNYYDGEIVLIATSVENKSDTSIELLTNSINAPSIVVNVDTILNGRKYLTEPGEPIKISPALGRLLLLPGEVITRNVQWNLRIGKNVIAPDGDYIVTADIQLTNDKFDILDKLEISTEIQVITGYTFILPTVAMATSFSHHAIQEWYSINNYERKCVLDNGDKGRIVNFSDNKSMFTDLFIEFTDNEKSTETIPGCGFQLIEGPYWEIAFNRNLGNHAGDFSITIDAINGDIIKFRSL